MQLRQTRRTSLKKRHNSPLPSFLSRAGAAPRRRRRPHPPLRLSPVRSNPTGLSAVSPSSSSPEIASRDAADVPESLPPCSATFGAADGPPATYRRRRRQIRAPRVQPRPTPPEPRPGLPCFAAGVRVAAAAAPPVGDVILTSPRWAWAGTGPAVGPACVLAACISPFFFVLSFFPAFIFL